MYRVLVVDDDQHARDALVFLLSGEGYEVYEAPDGAEALEYLEKLPFDLVLLDQAMPRKTGLQVMEALQCIAHPTRVIFVTAHDSDRVRQQAEELRAAAFVVKPINRRELIRLVQETLAKSPDLPPEEGAGGGVARAKRQAGTGRKRVTRR